jgi:hypothetical protein
MFVDRYSCVNALQAAAAMPYHVPMQFENVVSPPTYTTYNLPAQFFPFRPLPVLVKAPPKLRVVASKSK